MTSLRRTPVSLVVLATLVSSGSVGAAGYQLAEYSATGLGRAYAGEAAMADNAGAQWRNPAMLTYLEGTQVSGGLLFVDPNIDVSGTATDIFGTPTNTSASDIAHSAFIPNFYISHQISDRLFAGLAFSSNYGMETELSSDFAATHFGNQASIMSMEAVANLGYRVNDQWSFGAGVRYVMGDGHFGATAPANPFGVSQGTTLKYMEGDDTSWGYVIGSAWQINDDHRIGFTYKSEVMMDFEGHAEYFNKDTGTVIKRDGSLSVPLPATLELASYHQLTDKWAVHASFNWTQWSEFHELVAEFTDGSSDSIKLENWKDNYRFALGTTYDLSKALTVRSGIAYDMGAVDDKYRTTTIPETDRTWLSAGATYRFTDQFSIDGGLTYILAKDASIYEPRDSSDQEAADLFGTFVGGITGDVWLVGIQANYRF